MRSGSWRYGQAGSKKERWTGHLLEGVMIDKIFGPDLSYLAGSLLWAYMDFLFALVLLLGHYSRKIRALPLYLVFGAMVPTLFVALWFVPMEVVKWKAHLVEVLIYTACWGIFVFILICEWLMRGAANGLTEKRGEKWTKEMDYVYISLASVGVVSFLARAENFAERFEVAYTFSALVLVTALVVRLVKTRAEINGWNKPGQNNDPAGDAIMTSD
jgi:hypothetical protein